MYRGPSYQGAPVDADALTTIPNKEQYSARLPVWPAPHALALPDSSLGMETGVQRAERQELQALGRGDPARV